MEFGEALKQLRRERNISQDELAMDIMSRSSIAKIENSHQQPSFENALNLIHRLGVSVLDFIRVMDGNINTENVISQYYELNLFTNQMIANQLTDLAKEVYSITNNEISKNIYLSTLVMNKYHFLPNDELGKLAQSIWMRLESIEYWSKLDLHLINNLLFLLDEPHARQVMLKSINIIETSYPELRQLKCSFLINYAEIALKANENIFAKRYFKLAEKASLDDQRYDIYLYAQYQLAALNKDVVLMEDCLKTLDRIGAKDLIAVITDANK